MYSLGDVPVPFLRAVDTTGGNSGSPTLNAKGELVGLLFDGNYECLSAGWIFNPELTRSINVDARYMRWAMDEVAHAERLLEEMCLRSEEHTSELPSLMRISYAVLGLKHKIKH